MALWVVRVPVGRHVRMFDCGWACICSLIQASSSSQLAGGEGGKFGIQVGRGRKDRAGHVAAVVTTGGFERKLQNSGDFQGVDSRRPMRMIVFGLSRERPACGSLFRVGFFIWACLVGGYRRQWLASDCSLTIW